MTLLIQKVRKLKLGFFLTKACMAQILNTKLKIFKMEEHIVVTPTVLQKNIPFMAGEKMPEGHEVVNVAGKGDELLFLPAPVGTATNGFSNPTTAEFWMYYDSDEGYLYPYKEVDDINAGWALSNNKVKVYAYETLDRNATEMVAELEAAKKSGGGASSEEVEKLKKEPAEKSNSGPGNAKLAELAATIKTAQEQSAKAAEELKVLLAGTQTNSGSALSQVITIKGIPLTIVSTHSEALKNPSLFAQYVDAVIEMLKTRPQVAAALIAQMASDPVSGKVDSLSESRLADTLKESGKDITISGSLSFASSVAPAAARELRNELIKEYGSDKQAVQAALPVPVTPTLNATVASSIVPDVIPDGLSPMAKALLERKSKPKKVVVGTAATEIDAEKAKFALKDKGKAVP